MRAPGAIPCVLSSLFDRAMQKPLLPHLPEFALSNKIAFTSLFPKCKPPGSPANTHSNGSTWGKTTFKGVLYSVRTTSRIDSVLQNGEVRVFSGSCRLRLPHFGKGSAALGKRSTRSSPIESLCCLLWKDEGQGMKQITHAIASN
jgi:hypothetical protein